MIRYLEMLKGFVKRIFGSANDRIIKEFKKTVDKINELEKVYITLSDAQLKEQTNILKTRLKAGETLDDILPNAFAIVREAGKRVLKLRAFDVQLIGGMILHKGQIAEMKTGEGKTLVAVFPSYLNALTEKGMHIVTVNDYLAKRDSEWMGKIHKFLGLTVGCILNGMNDQQRKEAYNCDITYGTNSEFGFDYLRDNMKTEAEELCQREFNFVVVDEVDSILIDEARTPLIISGPTDDNFKLYSAIDSIIKIVPDSMCKIDEKERTVSLNEEGLEYVEKVLKERGLVANEDHVYDIKNLDVVHLMEQSLKAHKLFKNEVHYMIKDNQVYLVDEFTGRIMEGRRFSDGLHQALEAKEGVKIQNENQTLASITYQNYFRMYPKLAGMTGTAMTEAVEFEHIYNLKTVEVPTNLPVKRGDAEDVIYKNNAGKYRAIIKEIKECYEKQQPVLVGTVSIEKSELLDKLLTEAKVPHNVLNAKYHEQEAYIIAQAGKPKAITIATNMAGRGTDIKLGGNIDFEIDRIQQDLTLTTEQKNKRIKLIEDEFEKNKEIVLNAGGLYILGTERHESRRIDNQLRGRSGRQGDIGKSKFFISLDDDLMRIFGSDKLGTMLERMGLTEDEAIVHPWISKSLERAQQKVENMHYEMRKNILKYDDVVNTQRKVIFEQRKDIMNSIDIEPEIEYLMEEKNRELCDKFTPNNVNIHKWNFQGLDAEIFRIYATKFNSEEFVKSDITINYKVLLDKINFLVKEVLTSKKEQYSEDILKQFEKRIFLLTIDKCWKDHLRNLDHVKQAINLRAYAQKDPLVEYKKEAYFLFEDLMYRINEEVLSLVIKLKLNLEAISDNNGYFKIKNRQPEMEENRADFVNAVNFLEQQKKMLLTQTQMIQKQQTVKNVQFDVNDKTTWETHTGRNDLCPCGSGKKYKQCCGKLE